MRFSYGCYWEFWTSYMWRWAAGWVVHCGRKERCVIIIIIIIITQRRHVPSRKTWRRTVWVSSRGKKFSVCDESRTLTAAVWRNFDKVRTNAWKACSARWDLGSGWAFGAELSKIKESFDSVGLLQDLPGCVQIISQQSCVPIHDTLAAVPYMCSFFFCTNA